MKLQEERVIAMKKNLEEKEQSLVDMMDKVQKQLEIIAREREVRGTMFQVHYHDSIF